MSAICGSVNFEDRELDFSVAERMKKMNFVRASEESTAFLEGGAVIILQKALAESVYYPDESGLEIRERRGKNFALAIDGIGIPPSELLERYFLRGGECFSLIDGGFACALYDGEKQCLFLARDEMGKKPLFYFVRHGRLFFSSSVNGLMASGEASSKVNRENLIQHITAPAGAFGVSDIYDGIFEVRAGECIMFSPLGICRFRPKKGLRSERIRSSFSLAKRAGGVFSDFGDYRSDKLGEYLLNSLLAFGYPQFDASVPAIAELLEKCADKGKKAVLYEDFAMPVGGYAYEKADRLCTFFGVYGMNVHTKEDSIRSKDRLWKLKTDLCERILESDKDRSALLYDIYGKERLLSLIKKLSAEKKEDSELLMRKIRVLGILCQLPDFIYGFGLKL